MKTKLIIFISLIGLLISSYAFAGCGCGGCSHCNSSSYCYSQESPCACTDYGWKWNTCMSREEFCAAFGNMGDND